MNALQIRTSKSFAKKKAGLTLLRLYRKHSDLLPISDWADRIINVLDDADLVGRMNIHLSYKAERRFCEYRA
jgi:hypothetical protein